MNIDTTQQPKIPYNNWKVESHDTSMGTIEWNPKDYELYLDESQKGGRIEGHKLRKKLKGKPVLNVTVLDWLLEHQDQIPEDWKNKYVYFWGTIYRHSGGGLCVRVLCFGGGRWCSRYIWLDLDFCGYGPAAVRASTQSSESQSDSSLTLSALSDRLTALEDKFEKLKNL